MIFRLWGLLGKRTGFEAPPSSLSPAKDADNVIALPVRAKPKGNLEEEVSSVSELKPSVEAGMKEIQAVDPSFRLEPFLNGAAAAFEMIVEAFATGNQSTLKPLLSSSVVTSFVGAI